MVHMKDSEFWAHGSKCYEQLKAMEGISHSKSWAYGSKCYEQL